MATATATVTVRDAPVLIRQDLGTCAEPGCREPASWRHPDDPERRLCRRHDWQRLLLLDLSIGDAPEPTGRA